MSAERQPLIAMEGVQKVYWMGREQVAALRGVSLTIGHGEYTAIMGPSGSGKSTMMHILGCLDVPTRGQYRFAGHDVAKLDDDQLAMLRNRAIGFIFQSFHLLPRMTALENVELALIYARVSPRERRQRATEALQRLGLGHRMHHLPQELSGGQQQRVAIARALVKNPLLILADEPTGALDSATSEEILKIFGELHAEGRTVVMVTHERDVAEHAPRRVEFLDGQIVHDNAPVEEAHHASH